MSSDDCSFRLVVSGYAGLVTIAAISLDVSRCPMHVIMNGVKLLAYSKAPMLDALGYCQGIYGVLRV